MSLTDRIARGLEAGWKVTDGATTAEILAKNRAVGDSCRGGPMRRWVHHGELDFQLPHASADVKSLGQPFRT
jgi:hypothetical protein